MWFILTFTSGIFRGRSFFLRFLVFSRSRGVIIVFATIFALSSRSSRSYRDCSVMVNIFFTEPSLPICTPVAGPTVYERGLLMGDSIVVANVEARERGGLSSSSGLGDSR